MSKVVIYVNVIKDKAHKTYGLLKPLEVPKEPWKHISMDHITGLTKSNGFTAILVVVDRFSKMIEFNTG